MKRLITTIVLATGLAAGPVMADHQGSNLLNKENVGGAVGAAIGGLAGNKIVDGKGQSAATAAGAVGGWLLGRNVARNYSGARHGSTGHSEYRRHGRGHDSYNHRGRDSYNHRQPRLNRINETFVAKTTSNVRAGPGTGYSITGRLHRRESVHVVGKVNNRNWYMVRAHGRQGFVYAPLLKRPHYGYRDQSRHSGYRNDRYGHNDRRSGWLR
ncbi:MAG: SH3 domain-containing protein [Gammaproteobacteria bacterium]|nr:SH3 domain-containing protein [Gammaproteobacteria bacterium]